MDYTTPSVRKSTYQNNLLVIKGLLAIIWGAMALFQGLLGDRFLILTFGLLNLLAAGLTLYYAYSNRHLRIAHQWLLLEGLVEVSAGVVFTFFVMTPAQFMVYMGYGIFFVVTLQFIYGYALLNMGKFELKNMVLRFASLMVGSHLAVVLIGEMVSAGVAYVTVGLFSLLYGALNIQFAAKLRNIVLGEVE